MNGRNQPAGGTSIMAGWCGHPGARVTRGVEKSQKLLGFASRMPPSDMPLTASGADSVVRGERAHGNLGTRRHGQSRPSRRSAELAKPVRALAACRE
jgi:hypothetical protein